MILTRLAPLAGLAALAACGPSSSPASAGPPQTPPASAPSAPAPRPAGGACPAPQRQAWVGQAVNSLPQRPEGETWRVVCTTCARTEDHRPDRLNIEFEQATGRIVSVTCG